MIRSRNWYPIFQDKRDEMTIRPFRYVAMRVRNMYRLENWRERHIDIKYRAMVNQKRSPFIFAGRMFYNR